jgi:alpha-N-arabinofuranosidase
MNTNRSILIGLSIAFCCFVFLQSPGCTQSSDSGAMHNVVVGQAATELPADPMTKVAIDIDAAKVTAHVSPTLYGLMTEEINYSYDGGLYGELINNRAFKGAEYTRGGRGGAAAPAATEPAKIQHWSVAKYNGGDGSIALDTEQPLNSALNVSLKLDASSVAANQRVGIANDGYWGIPVFPKTTYRASFYAKGDANFRGPLTVAIESNDGATVFATADVPRISTQWQKYTVKLDTGAVPESATNRFVITTGLPGTVWFDLVSLFPPTYNHRENGNRVDLMQLLVDMKPKFLRFPGGNYVEGNDKDNYFNWKKTVGDISQRPTHLSPWNYRSSDGMGLLEFLEWAQDMHAQPVLAVFAGFTLRGTFVATGDDLKPFVQDALDEIEYVTGDKTTKWGAQRIADGHSDPFPLNYVEIGNEDNLGGGARTYEERFGQFFDAIKAKYPQIKIIATAAVKGRVADLLDEHYYYNNDAESAEIAAHKYDLDKRPRGGPTKVFVGEWATRIGAPATNLKGALADAAFMTGMERNSDLVEISCYAPLFVNVNPRVMDGTTVKDPGGMQWPSDLIGFDALHSYGSPSYHVQKMFSDYLGNEVLDASIENTPTAMVTMRGGGRRGAAPTTRPPVAIEQLYCCVTRDSLKGTIYLNVVNISGAVQEARIDLKNATAVSPLGQSIVLASADNADTNTITDRTSILPVVSKLSGISSSFNHKFPAYSVSILQIEGR